MLFIVKWNIPYAVRNEAIERFRQSGGLPPTGVKFIARYHYVDGSGGISIGETDDPIAMYRWSQEWGDLLVMDTRPVLDDGQVRKALGWDD